jgi:hemerythrin-like metal-binding protein
VWDDSLSLGIPEIDADHRRLVGIIDAFNQAIITRQEKSEIQRILNLLIADAKSHFEHEARLFHDHGYPGVGHHAALHVDLTRQLVGVLELFNRTEFGYFWTEKALAIEKLVVDHVLDEDMKYRDFLKPLMPNSAGDQPRIG